MAVIVLTQRKRVTWKINHAEVLVPQFRAWKLFRIWAMLTSPGIQECMFLITICIQRDKRMSPFLSLIRVKSKLCYDRRSVGQSVLVSSTHLGPKTRFLLLSDSFTSVDVGRALWREGGSVAYKCLASIVILKSESCGTHDHISLSQFRDSPNLEGQVPVFISPGTGWPSYNPRPWVAFCYESEGVLYTQNVLSISPARTAEGTVWGEPPKLCILTPIQSLERQWKLHCTTSLS
jgi:hypothetical protein